MWLGRFEAPLPLRCRGKFHLYRATENGEARVVVVAADGLPGRNAGDCLQRFGAAHAALRGEGIARFCEAGQFEETPFVSFACDAVMDVEAVISRLAETHTKIEYAEAMAAVLLVAAALERAHSVPVADGGPFVLGAFGWSNVLISRDGGMHVFGFGYNVAAFDEAGGPSGAPAVFIAPEVGAGAPATPSSDLYAFVAMQRAMLSYVATPEALRAAFVGDPVDHDSRALAEVVAWNNQHVLGAAPSQRASVAEARRQWEREIAALGLPSGDALLRTRLAALVFADEEPEVSSIGRVTEALTVSADAGWLRAPSGERFELIGRHAIRRLLLTLIRHRREHPGEHLSSDALLEIGWPGERPIREAGLNRVYAAMSQLRKRGLREIIQRSDGGYRIDPKLAVVVELERS